MKLSICIPVYNGTDTVAELVSELQKVFAKTNFEIVMANEYEKDIATAYSMNHPTVNMIQGDIRDITEEQLKAFQEAVADVSAGLKAEYGEEACAAFGIK